MIQKFPTMDNDCRNGQPVLANNRIEKEKWTFRNDAAMQQIYTQKFVESVGTAARGALASPVAQSTGAVWFPRHCPTSSKFKHIAA
jgi:hypothetical protein